MSIASELQKARRYIERGWVRENFAVNERGEGVDCRSRAATRFCIIGACERANASQDARDALHAVVGVPLVSFNDGVAKSKLDVLRAFDRAIAKAKAAA